MSDHKYKGVLVSPLGLAPGAVSGVYFALREEGFDIGKVITVGTSDRHVQRAAKRYLTPLLKHEGVDYEPMHILAEELHSNDDEEDNDQVLSYVAKVGLAWRKHRQGRAGSHGRDRRPQRDGSAGRVGGQPLRRGLSVAPLGARRYRAGGPRGEPASPRPP